MAAVSLAPVTVSGGGRTKMQKLEQQRYRRVVCGNPENKHQIRKGVKHKHLTHLNIILSSLNAKWKKVRAVF